MKNKNTVLYKQDILTHIWYFIESVS